ncbi:MULTISPECIES: heavy-metal-associated domain-containing protein [Actinomycetes]|uniref:heavy-metal-associated domain-containing protein n=1 Tax=Actinomycetes TaxID=1760 RepID=UPI003665BB0D
MTTWTVPVEGLHCQGCVNTVTEELTSLEEVNSVSVDLDTHGVSQVTIDASKQLSDDTIQAALAEHGNFSITRG